MNVRGSAAVLAQSMKDLSLEWEQAQVSWRDVKSRDFSEKYLEPLPAYVARAMAAMEELDAILQKVRKDCE